MDPALNLNYSSPILNKLTDECLEKVFQFLHLEDLCNAADVCQRFKHNADKVFKSVNTNLNILKLMEGNKNYHNDWFMVRWLSETFLKSAEKLFRNFGPFIQALHLTGVGEMDGMDENELLKLVKTYCPSLKELSLHDIGRNGDFSTELLPLFGSLEKLSVFAADVNDSFVAILSECREMKHLNVRSVPATMWMDHKFPKLETLVISNNWEFNYPEFKSFMKFHENLKSLKYDDTDIISEFFSILSNFALKLETFHCNFDFIIDYDDEEDEVEENILQLSKLKSLKNLTFTCETSTLNLLVDAFNKDDTPIENFQLLDCQIDSEFIIGLSKLKSMKTLKLTRCEMTKELLIHLNEHLKRLDKITIKDIKGFKLHGHISLAENVRVEKSSKTLKQPHVDQDSAEILSILNDDCLMEIFEFLPLSDLCNAADVCERFQQNAQTVFQLHHTSFSTKKLANTDDDGSVHTDFHMAEQLFRNFGFFIQKLHLKGRYLKNDIEQQNIMYLATKYCISMSFKTLTLDEIHINVEMRWLFPLLNMFHRLPKLELHSCRLNANFGKFISFCRIPTIQVYSPYGSTKWMNYTFWYLRQMILVDIWVSESVINEFIKLNGQLQLLMIHGSNLSSEIFKTVVEHMPELQLFDFSGKNPRDRKIRENVLHLARLKNLTRLTLNCSSFSVKDLIDELVKASVQLSEFNISFGTVDMELLQKLTNLKSSLKNLQLRRVNLKKVSLIDVVSKLPDLKELDLDIKGIDVNDIIKMLPFAEKLNRLTIGSERSHVQIDVVNYEKILRIVKSRGNSINLCIHINSEYQHVFVPQQLLRESSYWLKVENDIINNLSLVMSDSESDTELLDSDSSFDDDDDDGVPDDAEEADVTEESDGGDESDGADESDVQDSDDEESSDHSVMSIEDI